MVKIVTIVTDLHVVRQVGSSEASLVGRAEVPLVTILLKEVLKQTKVRQELF